ncbi:MAG: hypothetical protein ACMG6E_00340 [Candidatus Roizmanbacteria bacterium]
MDTQDSSTPGQTPSTDQIVGAKPPLNNKKTIFLVLGVIILIGSALFLLYINLTQKQETRSKASETPECHNGTPPLPIDPECSTELLKGHVLCSNIDSCGGLSAAQKAAILSSQCPSPSTKIPASSLPAGHECKVEYGCTAPHQGYCKEKGACYECRTQSQGLKSICPCTQATPTPPTVEKSKCEMPYQCLPAEECVPESVKKSGTTNTSVDTGLLCSPNTFCCIRKQPSPTISTCPVPGAVSKVEISCPICENK